MNKYRAIIKNLVNVSVEARTPSEARRKAVSKIMKNNIDNIQKSDLFDLLIVKL